MTFDTSNDFAVPFPVPTVDPDNTGSLVLRRLSSEWLTLIMGCVGELLHNPNNWDWADQDALSDILAKVRHVESQLMEDVELPSMSYIGAIEPCAVATLPVNRLWCDGATYNRLDYPELYAALDAAFHVDADTFTVPDLRGRMPVGAAGQWAIGVNGGEAEHTLTINEMPKHSHSFEAPAWQLFKNPVLNHVGEYSWNAAPGTGLFGRVTSGVLSAGDNAAHNNMPPFLAVRFAIVASL